MKTRPLAVLFVALAALTAACGGDDPVEPAPRPTLQFTPVTLDLDTLRSGSFELRNTGSVDAGSLIVGFERLRDASGAQFFMQTSVTPTSIASLPAGAVDTIVFELMPEETTPAGEYQTTINAAAGTDILAAAVVDLVVQ